MNDYAKPLLVEVREMNRGLNPSLWSWLVISQTGGRRELLASGTTGTGEDAMQAAAAAACRLVPRFARPA